MNPLIRILTDIQLFSRIIIKKPLHRYQTKPAQALIDSIIHNKGLEFVWIFPRQSGKDETVAQLQTYLLTLFQRVEGYLVHVYPTATQIATGITRLENRLENNLTAGHWWSKAKPPRRGIKTAQVSFFSGHPQARAEGATANLLLVINETQDQHGPTIERRFTPMRASTNATALYVGTVRTTDDYLWQMKKRLEKQQAADGTRRVFIIPPEMVGAENPPYAAFVKSQIALKGRQHPSVKTELFNEPVDAADKLFPPRRIALMRGKHPRQHTPAPGDVTIITIDIGGQDEAATAGAFAKLQNPNRDYTVATVFAVDTHQNRPAYHAINVFIDHGSRHFQDAPGQPALIERLQTFIDHWHPVAVIVDASGVGQGISDALCDAYQTYPLIANFDFAKAHGKARLGNNFLSLIETNRFKYFNEDNTEGTDEWYFFTQTEHCGYELAEGIPIERGLRWGVPATATITVNGNTEPIHDDRLLSAALIAYAEELRTQGLLFFSTGASAVITR